MMTFWDTVRGAQLAETLIRELPRINRKKVQLFVTLDSAQAEKEMYEALEKGYLFKGSFPNSDKITVVVLEKEV